MSNILKLTADVETVNNGAAVHLNTTPLAGGAGREAKYSIPALPITSTVLVQGHGALADKGTPATDSASWETILTITSASDAVGEIEDLPEWVRLRTSVLDADGPDVAVYLEGVQ